MIRELTAYETSDGKRFDDMEKALEHVADAIREELDNRISCLVTAGRLSRNDTFRIIMSIIPHGDDAESLYKLLSRWIDY